jgi:peptidoglycan L-alanyl-D-glutamate endopeptidase CwlK
LGELQIKTGYTFSKRSLKNLDQCHPKLQKIAHEAIKEFDFIVICGYRGEKEQNEAFRRGTSKLKFPKSKHNKTPALAFDAVPYIKGAPGGIDWSARAKFLEMRKCFKRAADKLGIPVRFISWDLPHVELA